MKMPPDEQVDAAELRDRIIGLGEKSFRKSYYPELQKKLEDLERYKTLLDQSNDAIFLVKVPSGQFLSVSESADRQLGFSEGRLRTIYDLLPGNRIQLDNLFSGKVVSAVFDARLVKRGGEETPYEINMHRVMLGNNVYVVAVARDITERRRAEEALRKSEETFRHMADSSPMPMTLYDEAGNVIYLNKKFTEAYGYTIIDVPSLSYWWPRAYPDPGYRQNVMEEWSDRLERARHGSGEVEPMETRVTCKDGTVRDVEFYGTAIGEQRIAILQDITERKRAGEELRESEEKFRALAESSTAAIFILQGDRLVSANHSMEIITGYPKDELLTHRFTHFIHPDFKEMVLKRAEARQRGEQEPPQYEFKIVTGSGEVKWVLLSAGRIIYRGKPAVVGSIFDITDRKRAEEALRESEEKFRALAESSTAAIFVYQGDRYIWANRASEKITGYPEEELLKQRIIDIIHPDYKEEVLKRALARQRGEPALPLYETKIVTKSGEVKWILLSASRIAYRGKPAGVATLLDITQRKLSEKALQESEENLRMAIDGAHMGTWNWNLVTGELVWSDRSKEIFGLARNTTMSYDVFLHAVHPADRDLIGPAVQKALEQKTDYNVEMRALWPDGSLRWVAAKGRGFYDADGRATRMLGIVLDITERKLAEEAMLDAKAQAELYLDLMSHDITNMNQALMGCLEMMEITREAGEIDKDLIDNSIEIIKRSSRMIDEVKKLTIVQAGKVPQKAVDVCDMLSAVKARYSNVQGRAVTINYTPGPDCIVKADDMLMDVLDSLTENAVRHSTGPVTIDLAVEKVTREGRVWYEITVADTGPGIPDDLKKKIFMSLKELREKAVRRGFGLYLVRTLVDHYQGRVWVEDRVPGDYTKGSKFIVQLPSPQTRDSQA